MAYALKLPDVGEGITEGELVRWHVAVGDAVKNDQPIASVETDKAVVEIPSPIEGIILQLNGKPGDTILVGAVLAFIGKKGEIIGQQPQPVPPKESNPSATKEQKGVSVMGELEESQEVMAAPVYVKQELSESAILATPAVRKLAKDLGVELTHIHGSGSGGRITEEDVRLFSKKDVPDASDHAEETAGTAKIVRKYDLYGYVERSQLRGIRKATARLMRESVDHACHVTHHDWADVTQLWQIRESEKIKAQERNIKLTFLPFILKAVVHALIDHPYLNSSLDEVGQEIVLKKYYNIGVAVDVEEGLMVPVVKGADKKSILALAREIESLATAAKARQIDIMDLRGGTFTVTNIGSLGGVFATPIINYPEAAILGLGKIREMALVINGSLVIRKVLPLSLSFDHRILDGAEAARFVNTLIRSLEDPEPLLVELGS